MNIHTMKVQALRNGLEDENNPHGRTQVISLDGKWLLQCFCYRLTEFSFQLMVQQNGGWHSHCSLDEGEALAFLRGAGLAE